MGRAVQIVEDLRGCRKDEIVRVAMGCMEMCTGCHGVKIV